MAGNNIISSDTDFRHLVIDNNYPILSGGHWTAKLDDDGSTVYVSGGTSVKGPVNMIHGILDIESGAVVSGLNEIANVSGFNGDHANPLINVMSGGVIKDSNLINGDIYIYNGGISSDNSMVSEKVTIENGGISDNDTFYNPGDTAESGGTLINPNLTGGSSSFRTAANRSDIYYASGAVMTNHHMPDITSINSGTKNVRLHIANGAVYNEPENYVPPDFTNYPIENDYPLLTGGNWFADVDEEGKTYFQREGEPNSEKIYGPVDMIHGVLTIHSGAVVDGLYQLANMSGFAGDANPIIKIQSGGKLTNSTIFNGYLTVSSGGISQNNHYISEKCTIQNGGISDNDTFYNPTTSKEVKDEYYTSGGTLKNPNLKGGSSSFRTTDGAGEYNVANGAGFVNPHIDNSANANSTDITLPVKGDETFPCFLAGTLIKTDRGDIAVENLGVNDRVYIHTDNGLQLQPITSIVSDTHFVNTHLPDDEGGYPVCILKDAISENIPYQDTYVTPEHCLFIDGKFIPVRMLVNNHSIYYDHSQKMYKYYHIETGEHSVITANGMLTESYLNTRDTIKDDENNVIRLPKNWVNDAAAPLNVDRDSVEKVYNSLLDQALAKHIDRKGRKPLITNDHDICLIADNGNVIEKRIDNGKVTFVIPKNTKNVRIVSRASRPSDVIGPFVDDRRYLGLLIKSIKLFNKNKSFDIDIHLSEENLDGWHKLDSDSVRWTNGNAFLPLEDYCKDDKCVLVLEIVSAGPYVLEENEEHKKAVQQ